MKTLSARTRVCSFLLAVLTSAVVLGGTIIGMESDDEAGFGSPTSAMETVTVRAVAMS